MSFLPKRAARASAAQITAFDDTWHWGQEAEEAFHDLITTGPGEIVEAYCTPCAASWARTT